LKGTGKVLERYWKGGDMHLYNQYTYEPTEYLKRLRAGEYQLTMDDLAELYQVFLEGCRYVGEPPALRDFGQWISGKGSFEGKEPAEVTW
jgi:hypothetical protein